MWFRSFFCGVSMLALGCVLGTYRGSVTAGIIGWLTASIASLAVAVCARPDREMEDRARRALPILVTGLFGTYAAYQLTTGTVAPNSHIALWLLTVAALVLYLYCSPQGLNYHLCRTRIFPVLLIGFLIVGIRTIRNDPNPQIDVFLLQQASARALVHSQNPYTATIPDIYGPSSPFYIPLVRNGQTIYGFGYPPLIALLELPAFLAAGDVRYTHLFALLASSCLIAAMQTSWVSLCSAMLLLVNPFSLPLVEFAWIEPIVLFFLCTTLFAAGRYPRAVPWLFGLFLSAKQPLLATLALALLLMDKRWTWKNIAGFCARALGVVVILYVPFFIWNPDAFVLSLVTVQIRVPMRTDLISYMAYAAKKGWLVPPVWLPFVWLPGSVWLGLRKAPRTPAGFALASALMFIPFFALSKQGSPNYHFLGLGMMCCALAFSGRSD